MTTTPTPRRRAPGMSPDQRREMIVRTALPLVAEFGAAVTTNRIARAAGIGEATVFRAFTDKDELLGACLTEAMRPDQVLDALAEIPLDQPLAARLGEAAEAMRAHLSRLGSVMGALHASGYRRRGRTGSPEAGPPARPGPDGHHDSDDGGHHGSHHGRGEAMSQTHDALARLFAPDQDSLRLPAERLAAAFSTLVFAHARGMPGSSDVDGADPDMAELVDLFLHGALTVPEGHR